MIHKFYTVVSNGGSSFFCSQPEFSDEIIPGVVITDLYTPGQDPGYVAVTQLNYMFDRDVPCG